MTGNLTRTTITLPADLLAQVDQAIGEGKAASRAAFLTAALRRELVAVEEAAIDAEFVAMAADDDYQAEARSLGEEFVTEEWQILHETERGGHA